MAKGNMLLGYARGKVGDLVFKRVDGKQVTTPRVRVVKNPRTDAQTITRLALSTASKTAQHLRQLVNHSFQGIEYGQRSVNYFVSQLSKELQADIKAAMASTSAVDPFRTAPVLPNAATNVASGAPLLISRGDLDAPGYEWYDDAYWCIPWRTNSNFDLMIGLTVAEFCAILNGDINTQFTFVGGSVAELDYISESELFYGSRIDFARINFLPSAANLPIFIADSATTAKLNPAALDMERTDDRAVNWQFMSYDNEKIALGLNLNSEYKTDLFGRAYGDWCSFGIIASKYENNAWRRSACRLSIKPQESALGYIDNDGWNDIDSIMALLQTSKTVSEEEYLNKKKKGVAQTNPLNIEGRDEAGVTVSVVGDAIMASATLDAVATQTHFSFYVPDGSMVEGDYQIGETSVLEGNLSESMQLLEVVEGPEVTVEYDGLPGESGSATAPITIIKDEESYEYYLYLTIQRVG